MTGVQTCALPIFTGFEQVLITAAVFEDVPAHLAANAVHIRAGEIVDAPSPADVDGGAA